MKATTLLSVSCIPGTESKSGLKKEYGSLHVV